MEDGQDEDSVSGVGPGESSVSWAGEWLKLTLNDGRVFQILLDDIDLDAAATRAFAAIDAEAGGNTELLARDVLSLIAMVGKLVGVIQGRRSLWFRWVYWWRRRLGRQFSIDLRENPEDTR
jgi:hypothetical protein